MSESNIFSELTLAPTDAVFGVEMAYRADTDGRKVNLGIGAYRTEAEKPYVFEVVRKVEREMALDNTLDKEYLPIDGLFEMKKLSQELVFGEGIDRIASMQTVSGCGAIRSMAEFFKSYIPSTTRTVHISNPTWANHRAIFEMAGFPVKTYPFWNAEKLGLDFDAMICALGQAAEGDIVVLHGCAHNPTGCDPTEEQWLRIVETIQSRKLVALVDLAYQGFASGDLERDAYSCRLLLKSEVRFFVCQSFAKSMGMYGERIGMLHAVCANVDEQKIVLSRMKVINRTLISNPPRHGALIVARVLGDDKNRAAWEEELKAVSLRIRDMRTKLRSGLENRRAPGTWEHLTSQIGMFCYTGLKPEQCEALTNEHHIYLMKNGRISMAGLNHRNVEYVAESITAVLTKE